MRLTNDLRNAIIDNILKYVPTVNNNAAIEKLVNGEAHDQLPTALKKAIYEDKDVKNYLEYECLRTPPFRGIYVQNRHYKPSEKVIKQAQKLHNEQSESRSKIRKLREELKGLLGGITTLEKLIKQIPEFEKHVPDTSKPLKNLPVTQVIGDLMKAGWKNK